MSAEQTLVFVYGTLRQQESAHDLLEQCVHAGRASTRPQYTLHNMGPYPAMIDTGSTAVVGELYWIPTHRLRVLDAYEDHPRLYERTTIQLDHPKHADAIAYLMRSADTRGFPTIPTGDWQTIQESL